MVHRSPTRFLAPLALVAAVATIYVVAKPELEGSANGSKTSSTTTSSKTTPSSKPVSTSGARRKRAPKTYTVKSGDVLSTIAASTGVTVAQLLEYNDVDAQSLRLGQKLKLTP